MKALVLASGGIDSTACLFWAKAVYDEVRAVYFNYGQKQLREELCSLALVAKTAEVAYKVINLPFVAAMFTSNLLEGGGPVPDGSANKKLTYVPFRNGILLSIAVGLAESEGASVVVAGNHGDDSYPDSLPEFTNSMTAAARAGTYTAVDILFPFLSTTKAAVIRKGLDLGAPMTLTYSCYKGGELHCGTCSVCLNRKAAFKDSGIEDRTRYEKE